MTIDLTNDFQVLFATIDGEAEGEPLIGKQAVCASIMNRVAQAGVHPHFGDGTVKGACLAHMQYDAWNPGPDRDRIEALDPDAPKNQAQQDALDTARAALDGSLVDPTDNATYYYADTIAPPPWTVGAIFCGKFGTQLFYKGVK